jgi:hypothetical protein
MDDGKDGFSARENGARGWCFQGRLNKMDTADL